MRWIDNGITVDPEAYSTNEYPRHFWLSIDDGASFELMNVDEFANNRGTQKKGSLCSRLSSHEIIFPFEEFFSPTCRCDTTINTSLYSVRRFLVLEKQEPSVKMKNSIGVSAFYTLKNHIDDVLTGNSYLMAVNRQTASAYVIYDITKDIAFRDNCLLLGEFPKI